MKSHYVTIKQRGGAIRSIFINTAVSHSNKRFPKKAATVRQTLVDRNMFLYVNNLVKVNIALKPIL